VAPPLAGRRGGHGKSAMVKVEEKEEQNMKFRVVPRSVKALSVAALLLVAWMGAGSSAPVSRQACSGVLTHDVGGYMLKPDAGSKSLWCDAIIGFEERSSFAQRVLKTCMIGSRCHIEGSFKGHGVFYWTQISSIKLLRGDR
jgi:hypothetical protein